MFPTCGDTNKTVRRRSEDVKQRAGGSLNCDACSRSEIAFRDAACEGAKIFEGMADDGLHDARIEFLVGMQCDTRQADHAQEPFGERAIDHAVLFDSP